MPNFEVIKNKVNNYHSINDTPNKADTTDFGDVKVEKVKVKVNCANCLTCTIL